MSSWLVPVGVVFQEPCAAFRAFSDVVDVHFAGAALYSPSLVSRCRSTS